MNTNTFNEMTEEIKADEGVVHEVYLDHLGLPTVGVGHLIREDDPENGLVVGTKMILSEYTNYLKQIYILV